MSLSDTVYPELTSSYKLGNPNTKFSIWKLKIEFVLFELDLKYVLTDPKPSDPSPNSPQSEKTQFQKWLADDYCCRNIMLGATTEETFIFFHNIKTAKEMMEAMKNHFVSTSLMQRMILLKKYKDYKMVEGTKIMDHVLKMSSLARDVEEAGMEVNDEMQVVMLISSLPASWKPAVDMILMMEDIHGDKELSLNKMIRSLRNQEELRAWQSLKNENEVVIKNVNGDEGKKQKKGNCYNCGKPGHYRNECANDFDEDDYIL